MAKVVSCNQHLKISFSTVQSDLYKLRSLMTIIQSRLLFVSIQYSYTLHSVTEENRASAYSGVETLTCLKHFCHSRFYTEACLFVMFVDIEPQF